MLKEIGLSNIHNVFFNLSTAELVEKALERKEGVLASNGAIRVETGKYTGRSPKDRFIVEEEEVKDKISWGKINVPISEEIFEGVYKRVLAYLQNKDVFVFDGFAGADKNYRTAFRVVNEYAYQNLFIRNLLRRPSKEELANFLPGFHVVCAPGFKCDPELDGTNSEAAILVSFKRKIVLIAGARYAGEMKKSVFSVMNGLLPEKDVLPMHCSANMGEDRDVALFFGLSGTGKTTLSADPNRYLIGDDEHGWSKEGVFNFEGGCYAKTIDLTEEAEPEIWNAIKFGSVLENVILDEDNRTPDYEDNSLTENTRVGYPIEYIPNAELSGKGGIPKNIVFLTADAFGVLPPIAKLNKEQAMYQFLSGYTSKLAGTERGITEPEATFSTAFGEPFLPLHPLVYAEMLGKRIEEFNSNVYLINTGWSGGPYGVGQRMKLEYTRSMVTAVLNGDLDEVEFVDDEIFNISVPRECPNVPSEILKPINTWEDKDKYRETAENLAKKFHENFKKFNNIPENIKNAGPKFFK